MNKIKFDEPEYGKMLSDRFFRLDRYNTSNFTIGGKLEHPVIGKFTKLWGELEKDDIAYRYAFTAPVGYAHLIQKISPIFHAPITVIKFKIVEQTMIVTTGDLKWTGIASWADEVADEGIKMRDADIRATFVDIFTIFGVVRRFAGAPMDEDFRLCYYEECPHFRRNSCNSWVFIPRTILIVPSQNDGIFKIDLGSANASGQSRVDIRAEGAV